MSRSSKALLAESCAKALAVFALGHPIGAGCAVVLSTVIQTEPAAKLVELLGEELAKAVGIWFSEELTEVEPGSLPEAILLALRNALEKIRARNKDTVVANHWEQWFRNWEAACKSVRHHRWKDLRALALAIGNLNEQPGDWRFLKETLVLLNWSARLAGTGAANRDEMPSGLESLLKSALGEEFIGQIKELLADGKFNLAHVELTLEIASVASAALNQHVRVSRRLAGADDPRLQPMRGFFTGREMQLHSVVDFLRSGEKLAVVTGRIYSVQGGPGIGKTELCKAALREYLRELVDCRAYYIDVTGVRDADGLRVTLADALGNQRLAEDPASLLSELKTQTDLIYLDNLEDALPAEGESAKEVFGWLEEMMKCGIRTLASSRQRLGSIARELPLGRLGAEEAAALFRHFWAEGGGAAIGELAEFNRFIEHDLDCHALTIRLLALQAGEWGSWQNLRSQWMTARTRVAQDAGRNDRLSSLDVSVSLTFEQIGDSAAAELWIAFACFPDGMSLAARKSILPDEHALNDALGILNRHGLIDRPMGGWDSASVEMLAPFRQFVIGLDSSVTASVWRRCLEFFAGLAKWIESTELGDGNQRGTAVRTFSAEFGNLQECVLLEIERRNSPGLVERVHDALLNSYQFQVVAARGFLQCLDEYFRAQGRRRARADTLKALGDLENGLGNLNLARQRYEEALLIYISEQSNVGRANTLKALGDLESRLGNVDLALQRYGEALPIFASEQGDLGRANTLRSLGDMEYRLGNVDLARQRYEEALPIFVSRQENLGRANTLVALGDLEIRLGYVDLPRQRYQEALPLYVSGHDNLGRANTLKSLGDLESRVGNVDLARDQYEEALPLYASEQSNLGRANTLKALGDLESQRGNVDLTRQRYEEALLNYVSERENLGRANTLKALGDLERRMRNMGRARQRYEEALPLYVSERTPQGIALTSLGLAFVCSASEGSSAAGAFAKQARVAAAATNNPVVVEFVERGLTSLGLHASGTAQ